tara:strand:+ start:376 stop:834 length:459 start_codon:yes stop_codon:yes gene_type:complete
MARDRLQMKLVGGAKLDMVLAKMAIDNQSAATKIVKQSLNKGAAEVRKKEKQLAPTESGTLKKAIKNRLSRKTPNRNTFMASVYFAWKRASGSNKGEGGFYSIHTVRGTKNQRPNNFVKKAVQSSESKVRKTIGEQLAANIAAFGQAQVNKL